MVTNLSVEEVLSRVYLQIGPPRPYAFARMLNSRGPKTFQGVLNRPEILSNLDQRSRQEDVWIYGEVKPLPTGSIVRIEIQGDMFTPKLVIALSIILTLVGLLLGWLQLREGRFPTGTAIIWGMGVIGYTLSMFHFKSKAQYILTNLKKLLDVA